MLEELDKTAAEQVLKGIHLPPCPTVLMAVMKEARSENADIGKISTLISQDIGLSAPMLKLANSPFFGLRTRVSSVQQAVTVMGLRNTINLLSNVALRANVVPGVAGMEKFWDYSSLTALAASHLAGKIPGMNRDDAYMVGLFHDCSIPVLMHKYPDYTRHVDALTRARGDICKIESLNYSTTHAVVGSLLAGSWLLPKPMCRAILLHHDLTVFTSVKAPADVEICNWVGLIHAAEYIADTHLGLRNDSWAIWQSYVLRHLQFDEQEFAELCTDVGNLMGSER